MNVGQIVEVLKIYTTQLVNVLIYKKDKIIW